MNKHQQAIINVMEKRISRGASHFHIESYKNKLKQTWKNSDMAQFIDSIDITQLIQESKGGN